MKKLQMEQFSVELISDEEMMLNFEGGKIPMWLKGGSGSYLSVQVINY